MSCFSPHLLIDALSFTPFPEVSIRLSPVFKVALIAATDTRRLRSGLTDSTVLVSHFEENRVRVQCYFWSRDRISPELPYSEHGLL